MSAVEEIQAAIDKLCKDLSQSDYQEMNGWLAETVPGASGAIDDPGYAPITNDPIIVTLYRTIDAQLAILAAALGDAEGSHDEPGAFTLTLTLARAINGTV